MSLLAKSKLVRTTKQKPIIYFYARPSTGQTPDDLNQGLTYTTPAAGPTLNAVAVGTFQNKLDSAPNELVLASGATMVVYILSPGSISFSNIGLTSGFTVFTAQAMYYKETNVQAYTGP